MKHNALHGLIRPQILLVPMNHTRFVTNFSHRSRMPAGLPLPTSSACVLLLSNCRYLIRLLKRLNGNVVMDTTVPVSGAPLFQELRWLEEWYTSVSRGKSSQTSSSYTQNLVINTSMSSIPLITSVIGLLVCCGCIMGYSLICVTVYYIVQGCFTGIGVVPVLEKYSWHHAQQTGPYTWILWYRVPDIGSQHRMVSWLTPSKLIWYTLHTTFTRFYLNETKLRLQTLDWLGGNFCIHENGKDCRINLLGS